MRQPRLKWTAGTGIYHCVSRVVDRRHSLGEEEKRVFVRLMREYEAFCGVRVVTYCVMSNHFHLLVEVPPRPAVGPSADKILGLLGGLTGLTGVAEVREELNRCRRTGDRAGEARWVARFHARMWDISAYLKLLKQRFTQWFNRRHRRVGTLWEGRFKSVVVEGKGQALLAVAAYIDLNPVRAGLVGDPKDYRWSGYGEAVAGGGLAREGIRGVIEALVGQRESELRSLELYRMVVYQKGNQDREGRVKPGERGRLGLDPEEVMRVLRDKGRVPLAGYVGCRVRYFTDGGVVGSRPFVEAVFVGNRDRFGRRRRDGARRLRGIEEPLYALRDLRVNVFG